MKKVCTILFLAAGILLCPELNYAQMTPAGFNQLMADQKNWQLKQLPKNSVQRQMQWSSVPYETQWSTKKESLNPINLPQFRQQKNPMEAVYGSRMEQNDWQEPDRQEDWFKLDRFFKRTIGTLPYQNMDLRQ